MTDKEFKRLKRSELIEIIYEYQKREQVLQSRVEALQAQLFRDIEFGKQYVTNVLSH